jgi:hypothetical protein
MAAIMGLDPDAVARACAEAAEGEVVSPANLNMPGQVVIAGAAAAVARAGERAKTMGAKRVVPLPVSAPFHCALMKPAEERLAPELRALNANVEPFIPHRREHGYDLRSDTVQWAKKEGFQLILTVDCGIVAYEAAECAHELGIDLIVTDHHQPGPTLPRALAVINPHREDSQYPFPSLAGVGVAFKVATALVRHLREKVLEVYLRDNARAWRMLPDGSYQRLAPRQGEERIDSQATLLDPASAGPP